MNIGIAVNRIRTALGATQSEFSELTGISVSMISALEKGVRDLSETARENLLTVLGISYEELEVIAIEDLSEFEERHRALVKATKKGILAAITAQYSARKSLGMLR